MFTIKKCAGLTAILLILFVVIPIWARSCGGCGGRVSSGGSGSSGSRFGRTSSHSRSGTQSSPAEHKSNLAAFGFGLLGWFSFSMLRRRLGLHSYDPEKCTCPLEDHVLNWSERLVFLYFVSFPMLVLIFFCDFNPAGLIISLVGSLYYWAYDYAR